jgi:hypothetical protein
MEIFAAPFELKQQAPTAAALPLDAHHDGL